MWMSRDSSRTDEAVDCLIWVCCVCDEVGNALLLWFVIRVCCVVT